MPRASPAPRARQRPRRAERGRAIVLPLRSTREREDVIETNDPRYWEVFFEIQQVLVREAQGYDVSLFEAREMTRWRIHELRKAIEKDSKSPKFILTVRGIGYKFTDEAQ